MRRETPFPSTEAYIASFPPGTRKLLKEMRALIRRVVPDATEVISYGIPTFRLAGRNLVHFAGYEGHIGFYPGAGPLAAFKEEIASYKSGKGSVQFPLDQPLPEGLIRRMVAYRVEEHAAKASRRS